MLNYRRNGQERQQISMKYSSHMASSRILTKATENMIYTSLIGTKILMVRDPCQMESGTRARSMLRYPQKTMM